MKNALFKNVMTMAFNCIELKKKKTGRDLRLYSDRYSVNLMKFCHIF